MKMTDIGKRVTKLETLMEQHLMESGEIRTDIQWIKKGVLAATAAAFSSTGALIIAVVAFLLSKTH